MTDDNKSEILKAITDLTKTVEEYHGDFREFRGEIKTKVANLEADAKSARFWSRVHAVAVVPVVGTVHQVAEYLHWIR
jgi:hypothetical protein